MLSPATASAGRLIATGHDADQHCGRADAVTGVHGQCHSQVAVNYVRAGAPDPTKPVLVLDRGALDVVSSLDRVFGPGLPRTVIDPRSPAFRAAPITTELYSAVIIASSRGPANDPSPQDRNEFDSTPDSDAINVRAGDLRTFDSGGGGIYVNSGNTHVDDLTDLLCLLAVTVRGSSVKSPFVLTDAGRALGMVDNDVNCCPTHNTIEPPAEGSPLRTIDADSLGRIVSVYAETQRFSELADPTLTQAVRQEVVAGVPQSDAPSSNNSTTSCARRTVIPKLKRPKGLRLGRANIYVNGKFIKRYRGTRITHPIKLKLRKTRSGRANVRIVIYTTGKRRLAIRRTYKTCVFR